MIPGGADDHDASSTTAAAAAVAKGGKEEEEEERGGIEGIEGGCGMVVIGSGTVGRDDDDRDSGFLQNTQSQSPSSSPPSPDPVSKEDPREQLLMFAVERLLTISEFYGVDFIKDKIKLRILLSREEPITFEWLHRKYPFFVQRLSARFEIFSQEYERETHFLQKYLDDSPLLIYGETVLYDERYPREWAFVPPLTNSNRSNDEFAPDVLGPAATVSLLKWLQTTNLHLESGSQKPIAGQNQFDRWIQGVTEGGESGASTLKRTLGNIALIQNFMLKKIKCLRETMTKSWDLPQTNLVEDLLDLMDPSAAAEPVSRQFSTMSKCYESTPRSG